MMDKRIKRQDGRKRLLVKPAMTRVMSVGEGVFYAGGLRVKAGNDGGNERSRERSRAARAIGRIGEWRTPSYGRGERMRKYEKTKRRVSNCPNHYFIDARERERMTA